ncbi:hypothetical protein HPB47_017538, partial [Ixodes persulcatus]
MSGRVEVKRGLKQGCPLSPLLYTLYASELEQHLLKSGLGFSLTRVEEGCETHWTLPGLAYADDLVLMAGVMETLQKLVDVCEEEVALLGLKFNVLKSAVVQFSGNYTGSKVLRLQQEAVAVTRWVKRVYQLRKKNGFFTDPVQEDSVGKAHKHNIRAEDFYDNSLGSRLLFEARAGALRTLAYRQRFDPMIITIQCRLCDQEAETIEHLVLRCPALTPKWELAHTQADQASSHNSGRQATPPASVHGGCRVTATTAPQPAQAPPLAEALGFQDAADSGAHPAEM